LVEGVLARPPILIVMRALLVLGLTLMIPTVALRVPVIADDSSSVEFLAKANEAFTERFLKERMEEAVSCYEASLPHLDLLSVQSQAFVLDRLSQSYYELTTFSEGNTQEDRDLFEKGKAYGFRSLRLSPGFAELEEKDLKEAVGFVIDPAALLWAANNWGALFSYDPLQGMVNVGKVKAMYERCIEVEAGYWGGSSHNALGALLVTTPDFLGGDLEQGRKHLERAIELDETYLENHVVYAQYWGFAYDLFGNINGIRDRRLIERELNFVLAAPIGDWPFWNREAKKEAEILLVTMREFLP